MARRKQAPGRPYERKGCRSKRRFADRIAAELEGSRWGDMRPYRCPFCAGWHLAHKGKRR